MCWLYLFLAICMEVTGTVALKYSKGMTGTLPSVIAFAFYIGSICVLAHALKGINVGTAYAVWAGFGTALIAAIGIILFEEPITAVKVASIALIITGVVGLNVTGSFQ